MNFVVCDDDPRFAEGFESRIRDVCAYHNWECRCQCVDGQALLQMDFSAVDALFLDIEMPAAAAWTLPANCGPNTKT